MAKGDLPIPVCMPKLGMEMTEGLLAKWHVKVGDVITRGSDLFDIETEKLSVLQEAEFDGTLRKIIGEEGETYDVGALIAVVASAEVSEAAIDAFIVSYADGTGDREDQTELTEAEAEAKEPQAPALSAEPNRAEVANDAGPAPKDDQASSAATFDISPVALRYAKRHGIDLVGITPTGRLGRISLADVKAVAGDAGQSNGIRATPLARRIAKAEGVALETLRGTGPRGRVQRRDVESAKCSTPGTERASYQATSLSPMRRAIARRMVTSKSTVPHIYLHREFAMDRILDMRREYNASVSATKITLTDLLIRAVALAQGRVPEANVQFHDTEIRRFDRSDVCVAIATEGGLVSPVIPGADRRGLEDVSAAMRDLAERARTKALIAEDLEGGTVTLTNLGMAGVRSFEAIINPPQALIVAIGTTELRPANVDGALALAHRMDVTLSCDHRAIDGMVGAEYLEALGQLIERPIRLFGGGSA